MLHQFEEYVYPGGFRQWMNRQVYESDDAESPLGRKSAVVINVALGWPLFAAVAWLGQDQIWFTFPLLGVLFVNSWFHIVLSIAYNRYSPGTFTSILVVLPLTLYAFYYYVMTWEIGFRMLLISILTGLVFHLLVATLPREWAQARQHRLEREQADAAGNTPTQN